jgi:hypothetical protein
VKPYAEQMRRLLSRELPEIGAGAVIDHMISLAHEHDPSLGPFRLGDEIIESEPGDSVKVATELSKVTRVRRIALGKRYLRTMQLAAEQQCDKWKSTHSLKRSDCMLFLASPLPIERRQERRARVLALTQHLKHYHQVRKGLGIATEAGESAGQSYDFVFLDGEPIENEEASLAAKELFGEPIGPLTDEPRKGSPF